MVQNRSVPVLILQLNSKINELIDSVTELQEVVFSEQLATSRRLNAKAKSKTQDTLEGADSKA
jgi:hypothetical protein